MKTKSKIPALRFKGFTDAWEQRKFPEFVEFYNGLTYSPDDVRASGTLVLRSSNVKNGEIVDADNVYVEPDKATSENVKEGDIIVVVRNGSRALIGKHAEIKESMSNTVIGAFMSGIRSEHSSFVNALLDTNQFEKEIEKNMGATINQITGYMFSKMEFTIPSPTEQDKIGNYFKYLDHLITLHQRKCDQTKELKKTMLQKMFLKKGERIPEIRFPEFTDEWEEKKLGEVVEREIKGKAKANMQGTKSIYLETEYLNGGETTFVDSDADIEEDDILILWDGSQAGTVYHGFFGALGSTLKAYRPKESGKFVYYQLVAHQEMIFQRYRTPNIPHVIKTFTDEFSVFTTSLSEQERIGNFFKHLDTLIALHQSKCDSLKELKKTLLRQLFV